jgi:uncharacterized protein
MRIYFFWNDPLNSLVVLLFVLLPTFAALAPGLALALRARRRVAKVVARAGSPSIEELIDGAGAASAILAAGGAPGVRVITAKGPLATFYDPWHQELRLSKAVAEGRAPEALGIAAHEAGHALQEARGYWPSKARPLLILAARLGTGVAWMTLLAGLLMIEPDLTFRGALLYSAAVLALLPLQVVERDANRRTRAALTRAGLGESPTTADEAFQEALEAARWVEIASTLPNPRAWWSRRPGLF